MKTFSLAESADGLHWEDIYLVFADKKDWTDIHRVFRTLRGHDELHYAIFENTHGPFEEDWDIFDRAVDDGKELVPTILPSVTSARIVEQS